VAALTMPSLIANYQKKVVVTRLQRFDNIVGQMKSMFAADNSGTTLPECCTSADTRNPNFSAKQLEHFFQYAKHSDIEKMTGGALMGFPDGSGVYICQKQFLIRLVLRVG
jgi:hypothetical protein